MWESIINTRLKKREYVSCLRPRKSQEDLAVPVIKQVKKLFFKIPRSEQRFLGKLQKALPLRRQRNTTGP